MDTILKIGLHLLLFIITLTIAKAQEMYEYTRDFRFNDGIYLTIDEFKNNKPSIPLPEVIEGGRNQLGNTICMSSIEYILDDEVFDVKARDVWGICLNGNPFIRHDEGNLFPSKPCFFKLLAIGSISTFYMQKVQNEENNWPSYNYNAMRQLNSSKVKVLQFALDLETGEICNQKSQASRLIELIRRDASFTDQKIKKKDVGMYITLYNKKNPLYVPLR